MHVQQVKDNHKKRGIRDATIPRPHDQACPSNVSRRINFGIRELSRFIYRQQSLGNSNCKRSTKP